MTMKIMCLIEQVECSMDGILQQFSYIYLNTNKIWLHDMSY